MTFANPTNLSSPVDMMTYLNSVTNITTMSGETITTGFFAIGILMAIFAVFFLGFKEKFDTGKALVASLFITSIISYLFHIMGLIENNVVIAVTILTAVGIFVLFADI